MTTTAAVVGVAARATDVWKVYGSGEAQVVALRGISVELRRGQFTAIMGPSGSGKSTLMHCLAGLDTVTRGEVAIGDTKLNGLSDAKLTQLRRDQVGFIFQQFNLLPTLTAEENIRLPLSIAGRKPDRAWFDRVIDTVGLRDRLHHRPSQLSGGQQQRVAIARALVNEPQLVLADEPTGNLDPDLSLEIMNLFREINSRGTTVVVATHDRELIRRVGRRAVTLDHGRVVEVA